MTSRPALLLVDVQQDFLARVGLHPDAPTLIRSIADLLRQARHQGWPVLHVQTRVSADGSDWMPHWRRAGRADCVIGTAGALPPEAVRPMPGERVFTKRYFSAFDNADLLPALQAANIDKLVVAGIHTHACVREAVIGAYSRGFTVLVPTDAVASYDPAHAELTLRWLHGRAAQCLPMSDLLPRLAAGVGDRHTQ